MALSSFNSEHALESKILSEDVLISELEYLSKKLLSSILWTLGEAFVWEWTLWKI